MHAGLPTFETLSLNPTDVYGFDSLYELIGSLAGLPV